MAGAKATLEASLGSYASAGATDATRDLLRRVDAYLARAAQPAPGGSPELDAGEAAAVLVRQMTELVGEQRSLDACRSFRAFVDRFGSSRLDGVLLPLAVTVLPSGARVRLDGAEIGGDAVVLAYRPDARSELLVDREGFAPFVLRLDAPREPALAVFLERPSRWRFAATAAIDAPPLVSGGLVFVAGRDRCLTALDADDGAVV